MWEKNRKTNLRINSKKIIRVNLLICGKTKNKLKHLRQNK